MVWAPAYTPAQCNLFREAQVIYLSTWPVMFSLYYLPPINGWLGGDGARAKFPCTLSWITRKGLPRWCFVSMWLYACLHWWQIALDELVQSGFDVNALEQEQWIKVFMFSKFFVLGCISMILTPMKKLCLF